MRGARVILRRTALVTVAVALTACSGSTPAPDHASGTRAPSTTGASATSAATGGPSADSSPGAATSDPLAGSPTGSRTHPETRPTGAPGKVTVAVTGDVLPHASVLRDAAADAGGHGFRFTSMFAPVRSVISRADIAICQLETTLSASDTGLTTANSFVSPHELARDLVSSGFDGCSSANNHSLDAGLPGLVATRKVAAKNDLQLAGPSASASTPGQPAVYGGPLKVAQLSYSYTVDNAIEHDTAQPPSSAPWVRTNLYPARGPAGIIADARHARAAGADIVVVSMHWGVMFDATPTAEQRRYAKALLTSGEIDAIIGAHPHVVQPCQQIDGRYVLYSVGNFLSAQGPAADLTAAAQDGVIATLTFRRDTQGRIHQSMSYLPTYVGPGHVVHKAAPGSASYRRTVQSMSSLGDECHAAAVH